MFPKDRICLSLTIIIMFQYILFPSHASEEKITSWNADVTSTIINRSELAKLGESFSTWKVKQMIWPEVNEIDVSGVQVEETLKADCLGWLQKFVKKEYIPEDLVKHIVAMRGWGLICERIEQKRLCDVFITRFRKGPYVIHIQESPYNVVMAVSNETLEKNPSIEHKQLVIKIAENVLNDVLKPNPKSDNFHEKIYESGSSKYKITNITWSIDSLITIDSSGRKAIDLSKARKIGTKHINAETDGRFVRFEIIKCPGAVKAAFFDPYEERFRPTK